MDALSLVQFIYEAGNELVDRCESVRQCHSEATRIALRTVRTLGALEGASDKFTGSVVPISASLNELKGTLVQANELVKRCQRPKGAIATARALARVNANKAGLVKVEADLERITRDLHMPLLIDIRSSIKRIEDREGRDGFDERALQQAVQSAIREQLGARSAHGQGTLRDVIEAKVSTGSDAAAPANGPGTAGRVMFRLGRVRFDMLEEEDEVLGEGTFGVVHSGTYMGEEVAIKKARGPVGEQSVLREFRREAETHFAMRHDNIVRLLAFSEGGPQRPPCMVMERMEESLCTFLQTVDPPPSLGESLETVRDICQGLLFLHQHRIIHCDVKSANVLLDQAGTAKLSDFGLAIVSATVARSTRSDALQVGTMHYMAPEVQSGSKVTFASDVFSLHVVMWEVLTHRMIGFPIGERIRRFPDARLDLGESVPASHRGELQTLLNQCGNVEGDERPGMELVLQAVCGVLQRLKSVPSGAAAPAQAGNAEAAARLAPEPPHPSSLILRDNNASVGAAPAALDATTDRTALMRFFEATGGAAWCRNACWGTSAPLGEWHGVTVGDTGRVIKLGVEGHSMGNNMKGAIPQELGSLSALKELRLYWNGLTGTIPKELGRLTTLVHLDLNENNLCGVIPKELGRLTALKHLDLRRNQLSGDIPTELGRLAALEYLNLRNNKLTGVIPTELGRLTALKVLNLRTNELTVTEAQARRMFPNLDYLDV